MGAEIDVLVFRQLHQYHIPCTLGTGNTFNALQDPDDWEEARVLRKAELNDPMEKAKRELYIRERVVCDALYLENSTDDIKRFVGVQNKNHCENSSNSKDDILAHDYFLHRWRFKRVACCM